MNSTDRTFCHDKYWLKRARIRVDRVTGAEPGLVTAADGTAVVDVRIEGGCIRAVVPAGGAPCCCRGIDLDGGAVHPLEDGGCIAPGRPADLRVEQAGGGLVLRGGRPEEGTAAIGRVCTPPAPRS
ncbi:hypothetical protein [Azospirillum halopraeferens]|uniref:hypothetical protein n=1 Tax=Azospirillum halopraeferens TaxID=34010 RepID=UPI00040702ED|nr:hypothetical protein [Azospirillum halopraeferens]